MCVVLQIYIVFTRGAPKEAVKKKDEAVIIISFFVMKFHQNHTGKWPWCLMNVHKMNRTGLPGHDAAPRIPLSVICISCPLGASKAAPTVSSKYTSQKWKNCSHTLLRNNLHFFMFIITWVWSAGTVTYYFVSLLSLCLFCDQVISWLIGTISYRWLGDVYFVLGFRP